MANRRNPKRWAVGYLNPYYNTTIFVKSVDKLGGMSLTSFHDEGLADALLMTMEVALGILNRDMPAMLPSPSFIIEVPLDRVAEMTPKRRQGAVVTH